MEPSLTICLTGPESTGKTTLASRLANDLGGTCVPEFARAYLLSINRAYVQSDLLTIASKQRQAVARAVMESPSFVFCDTDLLVVRIWSEEKYSTCDPMIMHWVEKETYDLTLLCYPDLPWEADPLRENPQDRLRLFEHYKKRLMELDRSFTVIRGDGELRYEAARKAVRQARVNARP